MTGKFFSGIGAASRTAVLIAILGSAAQAGTVLFNQPFDGTGNAYSSQNDTASFGLFAQTYDNFTLGSAATITEVQFTGEYFNPPTQGPITAWTVDIYADSAGQPGSLVYSFNVAGTGGETLLGTFGGFPTYTYDISGLSFSAAGGTQYWLDVYPDLAFPPQWGSSSARAATWNLLPGFLRHTFTTRRRHGFHVIGNSGVPEPATFGLMGIGLLGLGFARRKFRG